MIVTIQALATEAAEVAEAVRAKVEPVRPGYGLPPWAPIAIAAGVVGLLALALIMVLMRRRPKRYVYRGGIPEVLGRRHLLYEDDSSAEQKTSIAKAYMDESRVEDALEFFGHADDREGLRKMKEEALRIGSSYLLGRVYDFDAGMVADADWESLAANAERLNRPSDAERARAILRGEEEPEEKAPDDPPKGKAPPKEADA